MTKKELEAEVKKMGMAGAHAGSDFTTLARASEFALRRIEQGFIENLKELKICWASFADGFQTGRRFPGDIK